MPTRRRSTNVTNINSLTASSITAGSLSGLTSLSVSGTLTATTVKATSDIQVNGTSYSLTQLDRVNVTTIGTAQASKALVLDANRSASNIYNLTIDPNGTVIVCSTLKFWNAAGTASNTLAHMYYVGVQEGYGGVGWDNTNGQRVRIGITSQDGTWAGYPNSIYGGPYTNGSDRRLKTDLRDCPHGLSTVMQMRPRVFRWKSSDDTEPDSIGFIAQELQPLVPEVVSGDESCPEDENGMIAYPMSIEMASITAVLCKAIQELTARVEDLEHKAVP
uniref:Peptidase S74 domain-containing protein n=1 Tax=Phytophthora fragariae TaxID=53985 RepID=A0A6A3EE41_9STRA|nr:hypothetical protein PF009_g19090 [Phytophthora fragariae]